MKSAQLRVPADVPIVFSDVQFNTEGGGIRGGSYTIKNASPAGLVTLVIFWRFGSGGPHTTQVIDSWITDAAFLGSGKQEQEKLNVWVTPSSPSHRIDSITGIVLYAEFDNGARLGPGVGTIAPNLHAQRERILSEYQDFLAKAQSGMSDQHLGSYIAGTDRRLRWLVALEGRAGRSGLIAELSKPRQLRP